MPSDRRTLNLARVALYLAAVFIAFVGVIIGVDQMYLMAAALFLLPQASRLVGRVLRDGLAGERRLTTLCGVGEVVPVTVTLTNTGRLPKMYLRVSDRLPRRLHAVGERAPIILQLAPGESREVTYFLEAERRGVYLVGPTQVETTDPLGFYAFTQRVGGQTELAVYPAPLPLRRVFFAESAAPGWRGQEAVQVRGSGMEFHGVREYQPGDELRHVHWRTTARTGTLSVAEYAQGAGRDAVIALDLSRAAYARLGGAAEDALEAAVTMAVSLADFLLRQGAAVRLLTSHDADNPAPPVAGPAQMPRILGALVRAEADSALSLAETLTRGRLRLARGTTLLYITPAADDPALAAVLEDFAAHGASISGLALLEDSPRPVPGHARPVRRGDDLQRVLED